MAGPELQFGHDKKRRGAAGTAPGMATGGLVLMQFLRYICAPARVTLRLGR
jgi:hypothetical protein